MRRLKRSGFVLLAAIAVCGGFPTVAAAAAEGGLPDAQFGRPFTLVDQNGGTVTDVQFRGKWLLVYFGYTHCPDTCPTALTDIAAALDAAGPARRDKVRALFITVDPERDTPPVMKDYVAAFQNPNIVGLTGTPQQVSAAEAIYKVQPSRRPTSDGDYTMSHSSALFIMNPEGQFVTRVSPESIGKRLVELVP